MNNNNPISFYDILNVHPNESLENIKLSYKNKIKYFKNKNLNENDIINIKKLKTALFILSNYQLRMAYNNLLIQKIEEAKINNIDTPSVNNLDTLSINNLDTLSINNIDTLSINNIDTTLVNNIDTTLVNNIDDISVNNNSEAPVEVSALNDDNNNINLDLLFQINTPKIESSSEYNKKANKMNNVISDRIFSIPNTHKIMINNILPQQTREEKKLL